MFVDKQNKAMKEDIFFCIFFWRENERGTSKYIVCFDEKKRGTHCSNVRINATMRIDNRVGVANGMAFSLFLLLLLLFEFKEGMAFSLKFELFSWE